MMGDGGPGRATPGSFLIGDPPVRILRSWWGSLLCALCFMLVLYLLSSVSLSLALSCFPPALPCPRLRGPGVSCVVGRLLGRRAGGLGVLRGRDVCCYCGDGRPYPGPSVIAGNTGGCSLCLPGRVAALSRSFMSPLGFFASHFCRPVLLLSPGSFCRVMRPLAPFVFLVLWALLSFCNHFATVLLLWDVGRLSWRCADFTVRIILQTMSICI